MKYLPLLWSNLKRKKMRTLFTVLSVVTAFTLFGLLVAIHQGFGGNLKIVGANRLTMRRKVASTGALPISYRHRIARVSGVVAALPLAGFGAYYQDKKNSFGVAAVDPTAMHGAYPEAKAVGGSAAAWDKDRVGIMVGSDLAKKYGWKVGERIPINAYGAVRKSGSHTWDVKIDEIYHIAGGGRFNSNLFMHYKYFDESRAHDQGTVAIYIIRIANARQAGAISSKLDALFANSAPQTRTEPQKAEVQNYFRQFGNVGAIVIAITVAVFFSMLLVVANTMGQAIRERTAELAILKVLGFGNRGMIALVLGESLLITAIGGGVGLALSYALVDVLQSKLLRYFGAFGFSDWAVAIGIGLIAVFGAATGLLPALEVARMRTVNALRN